MPQVRSRVNGLIINIPADARGIIGRYATQGGNELIFDKRSLNGAPKPSEKPVTIESLNPDPGSPAARTQADAEALT